MQLITKVYFPKLAAPLSTLVAGFVDFVISMAILVAMLVYFDVAPTWRLIALPAFLLLMVASALAVSLWVSAFSVFYRDFQAVVPFVGSVGMYLTPIAYPSSLVPRAVRRTVLAQTRWWGSSKVSDGHCLGTRSF